jgi:hypothetical protein
MDRSVVQALDGPRLSSENDQVEQGDRADEQQGPSPGAAGGLDRGF